MSPDTRHAVTAPPATSHLTRSADSCTFGKKEESVLVDEEDVHGIASLHEGYVARGEEEDVMCVCVCVCD